MIESFTGASGAALIPITGLATGKAVEHLHYNITRVSDGPKDARGAKHQLAINVLSDDFQSSSWHLFDKTGTRYVIENVTSQRQEQLRKLQGEFQTLVQQKPNLNMPIEPGKPMN